MKVLKATLILHGGPLPGVHVMDAIEHEGQTWLVPEWLDFRTEGVTMPARIVSLANVPHERIDEAGLELVISFPLPAAVFSGELVQDDERVYTVIERPNIRLPIAN